MCSTSFVVMTVTAIVSAIFVYILKVIPPTYKFNRTEFHTVRDKKTASISMRLGYLFFNCFSFFLHSIPTFRVEITDEITSNNLIITNKINAKNIIQPSEIDTKSQMNMSYSSTFSYVSLKMSGLHG